VLALLEESASEVLEEADLAVELETLDALMFAEAQPSDEAWVLESLLLLEALDEDAPDADAEEDAWLEDLQLLDELELSTTS